MTKKELREEYRKKRSSINEKEKIKLDDLLLIRFQHLSFDDVQVLMTYAPMQHTAEPDVHLCARYLQHQTPGLQVAYPVIDFSTSTMQAMLVNEHTEFVQNIYKIEEPTGGEIIQPEVIDMIFIPLLVCDKQGHRAGYGKGFYDRYLNQCREEVLKIGFSYFEPVEVISDIHAFDIPLDFCITPHHIYEF
jgi:5-formyltetrahydrofolate cyclo-ligase